MSGVIPSALVGVEEVQHCHGELFVLHVLARLSEFLLISLADVDAFEALDLGV